MNELSRRTLWAILVAGIACCLAAPAWAEANIRGVLTDADGNPLPGVQVTLIPAQPDFMTLETKSNKKGKFVFGLVRPADYRLLAFMDGMRVWKIEANVAEPNDDSVWDHHGEMPQGSEMPQFRVTGLSMVTYDIQFKPHDGDPGQFGTGLPVAPSSVVIGLIEAGNMDEAMSEIERNLEDKPDSATFLYLKSFALRVGGDLDGALAAIDAALESDPLFEGASFLKGKILEEKGDLEGSVEFFELEAAQAASTSVRRDALLAMAVVLRELDRSKGAIAALEQLIEVEPDHVGAYKELSDLYLREGEEAKAKAMMDQVEALGGLDANLLYNLGAERFNAGELEEAEDYFSRAVAAAPDFADAYLRLAYTRLNLGQTEGAVEALETYLELNTEETQEVQTARAILQQLTKK